MRRASLVMMAVMAFFVNAAVAQVPAAERAALLALHQATGGGTEWVNDTGWSGAQGTECGWYGVSCSGGSVSALALSANGLIGALPATLVDLGGLASADIGYNGVWTNDSGVQAFLDTVDPDWDDTQTIAPADLAVATVTNTSVTLSWTPPAYTADGGGYIVTAQSMNGSTIFNDDFESGDTSMWQPGPEGKATAGYTVNSLEPGQQYIFAVQMYTSAHASNAIEVISTPVSLQGGPSGCSLLISLPGDVPMEFMAVPAGTFMMGSLPGPGAGPNEDLHQVTLTQNYYVGKYEVTQEQWEAVTGAPLSTNCSGYGMGPNYPTHCVSWYDVAGEGGFVDLLNAHLASTAQPTGFRLPSEAEWERAARAGTQTRFSFGDVFECDVTYTCEACATFNQYMWWCGSQPYDSRSQPVGSRLANAYGLFDMHGNVFEWVQDRYQDHLGTSPVIDPTGPTTGWDRVYRGGDWFRGAKFCRSAFRWPYHWTSRGITFGFRLAKTAE